ncbi:3-oxoadipate enol-lactonase [Pannonibacter tanglangensis]|uniref:3-oxoadipate enol-lactonase n=1 Tax=Pannonibacter tanglangensis TaxID=2750084 RepID=A0ABW9ZCQ3_9HYPH|nr:3-oxoadipate enol-lactonase [Pannonibacter sp. XCT-34]NBN62622.1 3-oxoadipate enol-lactonase [Pannonibacter sp. XCT-34]
MRMIAVNGVALHVEDSGEPHLPALAFCNSLGTDLRSWDAVAGQLRGRVRIIRHDARGHGLSDCPAGPYAVADLVDDLSALLGHLGVERCVPVGLSVGGLVAQGFAARHPDKVPALVLSNTAARIGTAETWQERIRLIEAGGIEAIAEPILERWFSAAFRGSEPVALAGWRAMLTRTPRQGYLATCAALAAADLTPSTSQLPMPTLVIAGSEDGATPPALVEATARLIRDARYTLIAGAGHLPCIEIPDAFCAALDAFLEETAVV